MTHRQIWDSGHEHVQTLQRDAALERVRREARTEPHPIGRPLAALVRVAAAALQRLADRLEPRPSHGRRDLRTVSSRPGGA